MITGAVLSDDEKHRYSLWRIWDEALPTVLFIGLNPSTADAETDDPTIRRCVQFAKDWGYGGLVVANLFSLRATDPDEMLASGDCSRGDNGRVLLQLLAESPLIICAWGVNGGHLKRDREAVAWLTDLGYSLFCLDTTKNGSPKHPLYIKADTIPRLYRGRV